MSGDVDVSVIIAAWRAEAFIRTALESVLSQTGVRLEVIVVDDASPDGTVGVVQKFSDVDPRVLLIRMPENGGPSAARNAGFEAARGRYVAVLDADDAMAPGRLAHLTRAADAVSADIMVDNLVRVTADGARIDDGAFLTGEAYTQSHEISLDAYVSGNVLMSGGSALGYLKPLFRLDFLKTHGLYYDVALRNSEDYYLVADILACGGRMHFEPLEGYLYRVDAGSISHRLTPVLTSALIAAETDFQTRHAVSLKAGEKRVLRGRMRRLRHVHAYVLIIDRLKRKRLPAAMAPLILQPGALGFVMSQFLGILGNRISGQKA